MNKVTKEQIDRFLEEKKVALVGVSRDKKKFGYLLYNNLVKNGYDVCPVNPNATEIDGQKCYASIKEVPARYSKLILVTPKNQTMDVVKEAHENRMDQLWIQQHSETKEAVAFAEENNMDVIYKRCVFMFADPVEGGHKFHRNILKFFGALPK